MHNEKKRILNMLFKIESVLKHFFNYKKKHMKKCIATFLNKDRIRLILNICDKLFEIKKVKRHI